MLIGNSASTTATELLFLQDAGLITIDPEVEQPTIYDVVDNPLDLEFILIENRSRTAAFDDADLMPIEALNIAGMNRDDVTVDDALFVDSGDNRDKYAHDIIITVTKENAEEDPQWLQDIDSAWHSKAFKDWLKETYGNAKIAAF